MKKLFLLAIIAGLCVSFKSNNGIDDFIGKWSYEHYSAGNNEVPYSTFELFLTKNNNKTEPIKGWYCSIIAHGNRIDCSADNNEYNIKGYYANDTVYVTFTGFYYPKSKGSAKIYKDNNKDLIWELGSCKGEFFLPEKVTLTAETDTLSKVNCDTLSFNSYYNKTKEYFENKQYDIIADNQAGYFKEYYTCNPLSEQNVLQYNELGYYFEQAGVLNIAIFILKKITTQFPFRIVAWLNLADAQWRNGYIEDSDFMEAKKSYKKYIELIKTQGKDTTKIPQRVYGRINKKIKH